MQTKFKMLFLLMLLFQTEIWANEIGGTLEFTTLYNSKLADIPFGKLIKDNQQLFHQHEAEFLIELCRTNQVLKLGHLEAHAGRLITMSDPDMSELRFSELDASQGSMKINGYRIVFSQFPMTWESYLQINKILALSMNYERSIVDYLIQPANAGAESNRLAVKVLLFMAQARIVLFLK